MRGRSAAEVLALPVRLRGIHLGRLTEVLLHADADRVLGFEVRCGDGAHRFMPFSVARIEVDEITLDSVLMLIDEPDAGFYRRHARRLSDLAFDEPWIDERGGVHRPRDPTR